jgi:hypothetical protein
MRSASMKLILWAGLCLLALTACLVGVDYLVGGDPEPAPGYRSVTLADLGAFQVRENVLLPGAAKQPGSFPTPTPTTFPAAIRSLDGAEVVIPGYMMPYDSDGDGKVLSFYLVRSILICCFGVPPRLNEIVRCEAQPGKSCPYYYNIPVRVYGRLRVAEIREYGQVQALYRLSVERIQQLKFPDHSLQPLPKTPNFPGAPAVPTVAAGANR